MRILLTHHHLNDGADSELYCRELATGLRRVGHEVAVFTFQPGRLSEQLARQGIPIFSVNDDARIEAFDPELLHVHHAPCLYYLGALRLRTTALFSSLGDTPTLESPPLVWDGVAQGLAVSEEALEALKRSRFGAAVPLTLFRHWFDDASLAKPGPQPVGEARRIAVVSHHLDARLRQDLEALRARHPGLTWTHFGLSSNPVEFGPKTLEGFDRVVTSGRMALLAAALQKPCLIHDAHGCDGLLTAERLGELATRNFSGRPTRARPSLEELEHLLLGEAQRVDVAALAEVVWRDFSLTRRIEELVALYEKARQSGIALGESARAAYGREGRVYAEAVLTARDLRTHAQGLERALAEKLTHSAGYDSRLAEAHRRVERLETERTSLTARLAEASREAESLREALAREQTASRTASAELSQSRQELARLRAYLHSIEDSLGWSVLARLRNMTEKVLPLGSRRGHLYQRLLGRITPAHDKPPESP